jgi:hypothetical protein
LPGESRVEHTGHGRVFFAGYFARLVEVTFVERRFDVVPGRTILANESRERYVSLDRDGRRYGGNQQYREHERPTLDEEINHCVENIHGMPS